MRTLTASTGSAFEPFVVVSYESPISCIKIESPNIGTTRLFKDYSSFIDANNINYVVSNIDCSDLVGKDSIANEQLRQLIVKHFAIYYTIKPR